MLLNQWCHLAGSIAAKTTLLSIFILISLLDGNSELTMIIGYLRCSVTEGHPCWPFLHQLCWLLVFRLWLNEGFASYMEYIGMSHVETDTAILDRFVLQSVHPTFKQGNCEPLILYSTNQILAFYPEVSCRLIC